MTLIRMLLSALVFFATPAYAETKQVDVALVLAIDESSSIDITRWRMQMKGYVSAFRDADVQAAIASGPNRCIVATVVAWSHTHEQAQTVPWTILCGKNDAEHFARSIDAVPRSYQSDTGIAAALEYSLKLLRQLPIHAERKIIDISGDGPENTIGRINLMYMRHRAVEEGVVINGLPIVTSHMPNIASYYTHNVIAGRNAFIVVAKSFEEFAAAIRQKLILEIAAQPLPKHAALK